MSSLRTRLARLELAVFRKRTEELQGSEEARRAFFTGLGAVLGPDREAKMAVGNWLERLVEQPDTRPRWEGATERSAPRCCRGAPEAANADQTYQDFLAELRQLLTAYPAAQAAVDQWLKTIDTRALP